MTSDNTNRPSNPDEVIDAWVQAATEAERRWNEYFNQVMGTDQFAQLMSRSMESYTAMQAAFARGMEQYLRAFNIPTRADIAQLAERVAMLEQKIDALTGALDAPVGADATTPSRRRPRSSGTRERAPNREDGRRRAAPARNS